MTGLVLWDVSSTYFEGRKCPLARHGYSQDRRGHRPQIVFGLLTTPEGCPVAVEVFPGNTGDPPTLSTAVDRLRDRFGLERMAGVGDRGMVTQARIEEEPALDGIYVVWTSMPAEELRAEEAVAAYRRLSKVERIFRAYKGVDLKVRPIHHWREDRVRAHVFLCMLAYYVEWHMKRRLEPFLSGEKGGGEHRFPTLLSDRATLTKNTVRVGEDITFDQISRPTDLQQRALDLLDVRPRLKPEACTPRDYENSGGRPNITIAYERKFGLVQERKKPTTFLC